MKPELNPPHLEVDTPAPLRVNADECAIKGWFVAGKALEFNPLMVVIDGVTYPVFTGLRRQDVNRHFGFPEEQAVGFIARFPKPKVEPAVVFAVKLDAGLRVIKRVPMDAHHASHGTQQKAAEKAANKYREWVEAYERRLYWPRDEIASRLSGLLHKPKISLIVPLRCPHRYLLERCIGSVLNQRYASWELIIAECLTGGCGLSELRPDLLNSDERIRRVPQQTSSGALNEAIRTAEGEFIAILGEDDELHSDALLEIVRALNSNPQTDLLYTDSDVIDFYGIRKEPEFKPDYDPETLLSFNYLSGLAVIRRSLAIEAGGIRIDYEAAAEWDLLLRALEGRDAKRVYHVTSPLYHRRVCWEVVKRGEKEDGRQRRAECRMIADQAQTHGDNVRIEAGVFDRSIRRKMTAPGRIKTAVFLQAADLYSQMAILKPAANGRQVSFYEMFDCLFRRLNFAAEEPEGAMEYGFSISSLSETEEDVFIFVNLPLEGVNHFFFDELASYAMRADCGVVSGVSIDKCRNIVHCGYASDRGGRLADAFAGWTFPVFHSARQFNLVRQVECFEPQFFAVRREVLSAAGGLGGVSGSQMTRFVRALAMQSAEQGLKVFVTPYAVALCGESPASALTLAGEPGAGRIRMNPNFSDLPKAGNDNGLWAKTFPKPGSHDQAGCF